MTQARPDAPYRGLTPFTADDACYFFGRDLERNLLDAQVRGARLTVLYGASGAGKSSLLQAGLAAYLRLVASDNRKRQRPPGVAVAFVNTWEREPQVRILQAAAAALTEASGVAQVEPTADATRFIETLEAWTERFDGRLILLLDQFEDYLSLRSRAGANHRFDAQLAELVDKSGLRIHVLISVQEESLARLDFLQEYVFNWFAGAVRLEHLTSTGAKAAIVLPLQAWNELHDIPAGLSCRADDALVSALLGHTSGESDSIATAYLQLVLKRLWDEELRLQSHVLRESTLDALGGVDAVVANHVATTLSGLSEVDKRSAAGILRMLVTPAGHRNSLTVDGLSAPQSPSLEEVTHTLRLLSDAERRITRPVSAADGALRYQVYHQVLVSPILNWLAARDAEQVQREKKRSRQSTKWAVAAISLAVAAVILVVVIRWNYHRDEQREQTARAGVLVHQAEALRERQFDLALLLALYAYQQGGGLEAQRFIAQSLESSPALGEFVGWSKAAVLSVTSNSHGRKIIAADADGELQAWSTVDRRAVGPPERLDWGAVTAVSYSRDGNTVAIVAPDGTTRIRSMADALFPIVSFPTQAASAVALNSDASVAAVGDSDGSVYLFRRPFSAAGQRVLVGTSSVEALDFSADGQHLVVTAADGNVVLLNTSDPRRATMLLATLSQAAHCVAFSPNGRMIAAGASEGTLHLWSGSGDAWSHRSMATSGGRIRSVAFNSNGDVVAAAGEDGVIRAWWALTGELELPPLTGHANPMRSIAFTADGSVISGQEDGSVRVWAASDSSAARKPGRDFALLRNRVCEIANRNLTESEWLRYVGADMKYTRVCPELPAGTEVDESR